MSKTSFFLTPQPQTTLTTLEAGVSFGASYHPSFTTEP